MEHNSYSPQMCQTCQMECYGRNTSRPGLGPYVFASAAALAGLVLVYMGRYSKPQ